MKIIGKNTVRYYNSLKADQKRLPQNHKSIYITIFYKNIASIIWIMRSNHRVNFKYKNYYESIQEVTTERLKLLSYPILNTVEKNHLS